jgi:S1-C subfamily serine protease
MVGLILTLVACSSSLKTPVRSPDSLHSHLGSSTVALVMTREDGDVRPYCTGVWVSPDEILTAKHCIEREVEGVDVDPLGSKVYYVIEKEVHESGEDPAAIHLGHVKAIDVDHDLAIVVAKAAGIPAHEYVTFASEMPALGEDIYVVGHPRGLYWSYVKGQVSAYRYDSSDVGPVVQVDATVWFGNSGGGVFDGSGKLVGICSRLTRVPHMNYFIHLDSVKKFYHELHEPVRDLSKKE